MEGISLGAGDGGYRGGGTAGEVALKFASFPPGPLLMCLPAHRDTHPPPQGLQHPQSKCHKVPCQFHRCRWRLPSLQVCHRLGAGPQKPLRTHPQSLRKADSLGDGPVLGQAADLWCGRAWVRLFLGLNIVSWVIGQGFLLLWSWVVLGPLSLK